ncbi:MAG: acetyltransferase [Deltaproteobacteria bacterium]|nr:acetyltransferase [Deltaproteobacteria bacterium]
MSAVQSRRPPVARRACIVGAGGFARELKWLLHEADAGRADLEFFGYLLSDMAAASERDSKNELLGDFDWLEENEVDEIYLGIGNPALRRKLGAELRARFPHLRFPSVVHPSVIYDKTSVELGEGVIVCANNVLTVNIEVHDFAMINLSCTVGHEAIIGEGCVMNPDVNISGGVELGPSVLVGTGAQILQYVKVGEGATIGAGAVVVKEVPPGATAIGVPAKLR